MGKKRGAAAVAEAIDMASGKTKPCQMPRLITVGRHFTLFDRWVHHQTNSSSKMVISQTDQEYLFRPPSFPDPFLTPGYTNILKGRKTGQVCNAAGNRSDHQLDHSSPNQISTTSRSHFHARGLICHLKSIISEFKCRLTFTSESLEGQK